MICWGLNRLVQLIFLFLDAYIACYIIYIYVCVCVAVVVRIHVWDCAWIQIDDFYTGLEKFVVVWQKQELKIDES